MGRVVAPYRSSNSTATGTAAAESTEQCGRAATPRRIAGLKVFYRETASRSSPGAKQRGSSAGGFRRLWEETW